MVVFLKNAFSSLSLKVRGLLSEPELSRFEKAERQALVDGFEDVRKLASSCVVQQIFDLFRESNILGKLFSREWARTTPSEDDYTPMETIVQTLYDAMVGKKQITLVERVSFSHVNLFFLPQDRMVRRHLRDKFVSDVAKECLDRLLQRYVQELLSRSSFTAETANCVLRDKDLVENQLGPLVQGKVCGLHGCFFKKTRFLTVHSVLLEPSFELDERHCHVSEDADGRSRAVHLDLQCLAG
jgi:histone H3/H4